MFKVFWVWDDDEEWREVWIELWEEDSGQEEIWQIALDILENDEYMIIVAPIAWVELSEIDLYLNKNVLTLRWKREKPEWVYEDGMKIRNSECFWGKFVRNIILPENLNFKKIKAIMENNLLIVSIPKQTFNSKSIKIDKVQVD